MKLVVQVVKEARVLVDSEIVGSINKGYLILVGFKQGDNLDVVKKLAKKVHDLRIFADENDKLNLSIVDVGGEILSVSQFTLYADVTKGRRPSFSESAPAASAKELYESFNQELRNYGLEVSTGIFQAQMEVELINDGPLTIIFDSEDFI